ncbi:MAG: hypothetical protein AMS14_09640 [Planctomycetes bacterium DG_20]|nr:MAG: hypothetical protein AMS14_09640 [Planctomycetes bacterium DG_20]
MRGRTEGAVGPAERADLVRPAHVSLAHITHFMNLTLLAPDIQEAILLLPSTAGGEHFGHAQRSAVERAAV